MTKPGLHLGDDGEVHGAPPVELPDKPKKRPPSRLRRWLRRGVVFLIISVPVALFTLVVTLISVGVIDITHFPLFRRFCVASLGTPRLTYLQKPGGESDSRRTSNKDSSSNSQSSYTPEFFSLYITDAEGTRSCLLVDFTSLAGRYLSSPDGKYIVYSVFSDKDREDSLRVVTVEDQQDRLLTTGKTLTPQAWTPDGRQLVYLGYTTGLGTLYMINVDGTNEHVIANDGLSKPTVSPDGRYVSYGSYTGGTKLLSLDGSA